MAPRKSASSRGRPGRQSKVPAKFLEGVLSTVVKKSSSNTGKKRGRPAKSNAVEGSTSATGTHGRSVHDSISMLANKTIGNGTKTEQEASSVGKKTSKGGMSMGKGQPKELQLLTSKLVPAADVNMKQNLFAVVEEHDNSDKVFYLVHNEGKRPGKKATCTVRLLQTGTLDNLYRPAPQFWIEKETSLIPVRTQFYPQTQNAPAGFKLLTLTDRILDTELT